MRKRSNSFMAGQPPAAGIVAVGAKLKAINPSAGANPTGLCYQCAIEAASVMTTAHRPLKTVDSKFPDVPSESPHGDHLHKSFEPGLDRSKKIFTWLLSGEVPAGAVFVVDMDDEDAGYHCWNYVKGPGLHPSIYLIDVSTDIFKEVIRPGHFSEWMTENFHQDMELFNYSDPDNMTESLEIYYWGQLAQPYLGLLTRETRPAEAPF